MPELICDTSPLQYLHQLDLLQVLPALAEQVVIPPAVVGELEVGHQLGVSLPDVSTLEWALVRQPTSDAALPLVTDLGPGETQVLMLTLESPGSVAVLDDRLARLVAETLGIRLTGTLGLLIDAKRAGLVDLVGPFLDRLEELRFRISAHTRTAVLRLAGEDV